MRYFVLAGEASGDLHGAALIGALKERDPQAEIMGWGGDLMAEAGANIVKHYRDLAFMGFVEVVRHLPEILRNLRNCKAQIREFKPDALILIDYPGFNLRIAKWAVRESFRVFYYISPQLWAWNEKRVEIIRSSVDRMFVILPFEQEFYRKHGIDVSYVGHPLLDIIRAYKSRHEFTRHDKTVALLPGSRQQEIDQLLPVYLALPSAFPDWHFEIAAAPHIDSKVYRSWMARIPSPNVSLVETGSYEVLSMASFAITTSGTATLEAAIFRVPQIVCYKGSFLSYQIAKRVIRVDYISLVNLIFGDKLVEELIQQECNPETLRQSFGQLILPEESQRIKEGYEKLIRDLGKGGAAQNAAAEIHAFISTSS